MRDRTTVFYDGACPLCRREIAFYRRRRGAEAVVWRDVSQQAAGDNVAPGLSTSKALARFHVARDDGRLVSGGDAFRALWQELPAFRPLAALFSLPGLRGMLHRAYDGFLALRPAIVRSFASADTGANYEERRGR